MLGGGDYSDDEWWANVFGGDPNDTMEQRRIRFLLRAKHDHDREFRELRSQLHKSHAKVRRLRDATTALLGPILMGGIIAFFLFLDQAETNWGKVLVCLCGAVGVWWLRDVGKAFDDVTRD